MNGKIQVLNIDIDDCTAKEAMKQTVAYMGTEAINVIEMVTVDTLMYASGDSALRENIEKIDLVDRNILRVAFYQLAFSRDVHPAIVIDEAVKLSQELSNDVSFKFINGILDAARKDMERK